MAYNVPCAWQGCRDLIERGDFGWIERNDVEPHPDLHLPLGLALCPSHAEVVAHYVREQTRYVDLPTDDEVDGFVDELKGRSTPPKTERPMNAERTLQWWTALACLPPDDAADQLGEPVCRCAPGVCLDVGEAVEVRCDECDGIMLGSTASRAVEVYRLSVADATAPGD